MSRHKIAKAAVGVKGGPLYDIRVSRIKHKDHVNAVRPPDIWRKSLQGWGTQYLQYKPGWWIGLVVNDARDKTVSVLVNHHFKQNKTNLMIKRSRKYHIHDKYNVARSGDVVLFKQVPQYSKTKAFGLVEVLRAVPQLHNFPPYTQADLAQQQKDRHIRSRMGQEWSKLDRTPAAKRNQQQQQEQGGSAKTQPKLGSKSSTKSWKNKKK